MMGLKDEIFHFSWFVTYAFQVEIFQYCIAISLLQFHDILSFLPTLPILRAKYLVIAGYMLRSIMHHALHVLPHVLYFMILHLK